MSVVRKLAGTALSLLVSSAVYAEDNGAVVIVELCAEEYCTEVPVLGPVVLERYGLVGSPPILIPLDMEKCRQYVRSPLAIIQAEVTLALHLATHKQHIAKIFCVAASSVRT